MIVAAEPPTIPRGITQMSSRILALAGVALIATAASTAAEARTQMRAVGSSTVYPFAKAVAERVARANPALGTPIIESTGTGAASSSPSSHITTPSASTHAAASRIIVSTAGASAADA